MTSNIANLLVALFQEYGFDVAQVGLILYCFWKLGTNHLAHLQVGIDKANKQINAVKRETHSMDKKIGSLTERVSHIEGKLNIDKK